MKFDRQPTLASEIVALRPLLETDFTALFGVASDPLLWEQHPASDRYKSDVFRQFFDDALASDGALIASQPDTGQVVGSSRYHDYLAEKRSVEIGWTFLARSHWGGTFNGEMKRLMLEHAFTAVDTVLFIIGVTNYRSQRAVEKLGAVRNGSRTGPGSTENYVFELSQPAYQSAASGCG